MSTGVEVDLAVLTRMHGWRASDINQMFRGLWLLPFGSFVVSSLLAVLARVLALVDRRLGCCECDLVLAPE
jgi:hypothetical protein